MLCCYVFLTMTTIRFAISMVVFNKLEHFDSAFLNTNTEQSKQKLWKKGKEDKESLLILLILGDGQKGYTNLRHGRINFPFVLLFEEFGVNSLALVILCT